MYEWQRRTNSIPHAGCKAVQISNLSLNTARPWKSPLHSSSSSNPEDLYLAILGSELPLHGGTANRVKLPSLKEDPKLSVEFYSTALLEGDLWNFGVLDRDYNYRLTGGIDQVNRVAYYSMRSLKRIERRKLGDG